jgi:regulation of enolase protein 1 (concanavalin A-like superfamily)
VSTGKGLAFQRRRTTGAESTHTWGGPGTAPRWVRLERAGSLITASVSDDGSTWAVVGSDTIALPATALVGLATTSRNLATPATGRFDHVAITAGRSLPSGWQSTDIGTVGRAGSGSATSGTFTVTGAGADVWGTADALQFTATALDGDGDIVARVAAVSGTQAWTKVGVMIRGTLDAGSAQAFMLVSIGKGLAFQRRTVTGAASLNTSGGAGVAPGWVRLSRRGQVITASVSADGAAWTEVGSDTFSMAGPAWAGLAVSSHDPAQLATGVFDNVSVTEY